MINGATMEAVEQARAFCEAAEADGWEFVTELGDTPGRGKRLEKEGWVMFCVYRPPANTYGPFGMVAIYDQNGRQVLFEGTTYSAQGLVNSEVEESDE